MLVLKQGLQNERLAFSLDKKFLKDYANVLVQAWKYAQMEEA